ncbi:HNH endonuclease [Clostridium butyricum]|uniref:HNH endonuclease domain protein n=1 Tax=Clostridium butyricum E4 str. BoNT E BL5262 TaxID=632245 RepID=C4IFW2_CLOBU|nr:HNH endonuclease [Clostridium butyricum]EDT75987.1 HNH endonuclease domain protein [Clostridium butyricum 5521]EEP52967.1 HNH endonuclease domain protein [Clostridium butyricum E4 str. BoNT E BL5262]NFL30468.1 HNH endonuclease [Clostridium butyricum]NFS17242.1 HNH endonuclease [Clostridium butyricum]
MVGFEKLKESDLIKEEIYNGGINGNIGDEPISKLMNCENSSGIRKKGHLTDEKLKYVILYMTGKHKHWQDKYDKDSDVLIYYGDQNKADKDIFDTPKKGNIVLNRTFEYLNKGMRDKICPFFVFEKESGRDVRFLGVAIPGNKNYEAKKCLQVVENNTEKGKVTNYKAIFTILNVERIDRRWLLDLDNLRGIESDYVPLQWKEWVYNEEIITPKSIEDLLNGESIQKTDNKTNMKYYFEPVNLKEWNMFERVKGIGHVEPFLAVKDMELGDLVFLYVGQQEKSKKNGIYAWGEIVKKPYILRNSTQDYCNNKLIVDVKILYITYNEPLLNYEQSKKVFTQFRTVHKLNESSISTLLFYIEDKINVYNRQIFPSDEIDEEYTLIEGAKKQIVVNAYERNVKARNECIEYYKKINNGQVKCEICGFNFGDIYGNQFRDKINIHHIVEIAQIGQGYIINPKEDLIPVCPNCHYILHCKKPAYKPEEVKRMLCNKK